MIRLRVETTLCARETWLAKLVSESTSFKPSESSMSMMKLRISAGRSDDRARWCYHGNACTGEISDGVGVGCGVNEIHNSEGNRRLFCEHVIIDVVVKTNLQQQSCALAYYANNAISVLVSGALTEKR